MESVFFFRFVPRSKFRLLTTNYYLAIDCPISVASRRAPISHDSELELNQIAPHHNDLAFERNHFRFVRSSSDLSSVNRGISISTDTRARRTFANAEHAQASNSMQCKTRTQRERKKKITHFAKDSHSIEQSRIMGCRCAHHRCTRCTRREFK